MRLHRLLCLATALLPASTSFGQALAPSTPISNAKPATEPSDGLPRTLQLKSGERVTGIVRSQNADAVVIESATLGMVTLKPDAIDKIIGPDGKVEGEVEAIAPADGGLFGTGLLKGWTRQLQAGVSGTSGTHDSAAFNVQVGASIDDERYRSVIGAYNFFSKDGSDTTRNETRVFGTFDKRLDDGPWFVFGKAQYDNDALQNWENRASVFGGPGYEFVRNPKYELLGRVGLGYTYEFGGDYPDGYDRARLEALVGLDGKWIIDTTQSLVGSVYYYPTLEDFSYGRIVTTAAYQIDLNATKGLAFRIGFEETNEFRTAGDDEHNNWKYFTNIVLKL
jgi:hypothetical protein